ncbi:MAG: helix-turn-helix transcriptional regulator [Thermodesulfovibrionales bacterium]|jgi:transcriptional regulator with XRE-family HTH domain
MHPSNLHLVFRIAREVQRKKQGYLATLVGVDRSAISKFESGIPALDKEKLLRIAPELSIDQDFILGRSLNPFQSKNLIRVLIPGLIVSDSSFFYLLISNAAKVEFISLVPELNIIEAIANLGLPGIPISAVAAKDEKGNIFLIRKKLKTDYIVRTNEVSLENKLSKLLYLAGKDKGQMTFKTLPIREELTKKIKEWQKVEKEDIAPLFDKARVVSELVEMFRHTQATPQEVEEALREYRLSKKQLKIARNK